LASVVGANASGVFLLAPIIGFPFRYDIRGGATRLMKSREVMILLFFQNFGKCR